MGHAQALRFCLPNLQTALALPPMEELAAQVPAGYKPVPDMAPIKLAL